MEQISSVSVVSAGMSPMLFVAASNCDIEGLNARWTPVVGSRCRLLESSRVIKVLSRRHRDLVVPSVHAPLAAVPIRRAFEARAAE